MKKLNNNTIDFKNKDSEVPDLNELPDGAF